MNVREKIHDIDCIVKDIDKFPQTYQTILKDFYSDGTCQFLLRTKLNKLCKQGIVFKSVIPGTRHGKVIFFTFPKEYYILTESSRIGTNTYVFFHYEKIGKTRIRLSQYWKLNNSKWDKYTKDKIILEGEVLKWV